jgi:hypothetical protein
MFRKTWVALAAAVASIPALAAVPAHPGMLNYIEGQASINGETLSVKSVGDSSVEPGQTIQTRDGKAEILLTPGVFLRLNNNSAATLVSGSLTNTRVELLHGQAMIEADDVHPENNLQVVDRGATAKIEKNGLYRFDVERPMIAVYDGKALVQENDKSVEVKKDHAVALDTTPLKSKKFDKNGSEDDLYAWSKLRSGYLAEANASSARTIVVNNGWYGPGWYWNPWFSAYTFMPGYGFVYSPFGWGFGYPWAYGGFYRPVYFGYPRYYRRAPVVVGQRGVGAIHGFSRAPSVAPSPGVSGFHGGAMGTGRR